jgi:hypothetical protein
MDHQEIDAEPKENFSNGPELEFSKAFLLGLIAFFIGLIIWYFVGLRG